MSKLLGFNYRQALRRLRPEILDKLPAASARLEPSAPLEEQHRFSYRTPPQTKLRKRRQQREGSGDER